MRLADHTLGVADDAGELARDGIEQRHRGDLAPAQDVGADRDAVGDDVEDALVDALVAAAEKRQILAGKFERQGVVSWTPLGVSSTTRRSSRTRGAATPNVASSAAQTTSMRITIPAPPPYGVSST